MDNTDKIDNYPKSTTNMVDVIQQVKVRKKNQPDKKKGEDKEKEKKREAK